MEVERLKLCFLLKQTPIISNDFSKDVKNIKHHNEAHLQTKEQAAMMFKQGCSTKHSPNGL